MFKGKWIGESRGKTPPDPPCQFKSKIHSVAKMLVGGKEAREDFPQCCNWINIRHDKMTEWIHVELIIQQTKRSLFDFIIKKRFEKEKAIIT